MMILCKKSVAGRSGVWARLALVASATLLGFAPAALAAVPTTATSLESVAVTSAAGNRVRMSFQLNGSAPTTDSFTISDPARIVVDFPGLKNAVVERFQRLGLGVVESVTVSEAPDRTRATIKLARLVPYKVETGASSVELLLDAGGGSTATGRGDAAVEASSDVKSDFRRGTEGQGIVSMGLPANVGPIDIRQEGERIVVDFRGLRLPADEERQLDVVDFATPVRTIDMFNYTGGARMVLMSGGPYEYLAYQANDQYTIEVRPVQPEEVAEDSGSRRKEFVGEPLSLNFQDIEVRAVLQILADFTGLNVVVSDSVQGNLTLRLKNVPWDQALDIILKTKGLSMRENGNVLLIAPTEEIAAREKLELEARKQTAELEPLTSDIVQINYAKAEEIGALLKSNEVSMLSVRGTITIDNRTNTLLVQDTASKIREIRNLVASLDIPVKQVLIDSRIVIARDDFTRELGIRWGGAFNGSSGDTLIGGAGTLSGANTVAGEGALQSSATSIAQRIGVNLGTSNPAYGTLGIALLGTDFLVDLELSALQSEGNGEVLSNPRVMTTNRQPAVIQQGVEIPYQEASSSGATTVSFKKAVLSLEVTPQITPNDRIIMDLAVTKDTVGVLVPIGIAGDSSGGAIPSIDTRSVESQVLVNDGETVVLGGVYERVQSKNTDKVPFLGDLPGIGALFRRNLLQDDKAELLIFVTPKIVREALALQ
jgi:type IV pilus assembly protein PilQ